MTATGWQSFDRPTSEEISAALARVAQSEGFRTSPQLVAFLRFVVDSTLAGTSDRIKGYTIAVEALGRPDDFDPQVDPIVRVEAARLRRALERYYTQHGAAEPIVITLPRGSYVPVFTRSAVQEIELTGAERLRQAAREMLAPLRRLHWSPTFGSVAAMVGAGIVLYGLFDTFLHDRWMGRVVAPTPANQTEITGGAVSSERRSSPAVRPFGPLLLVEPVTAIGSQADPRITAASLYERLVDAFARCDNVNLVTEAPPIDRAEPPAGAVLPHYRIASIIDNHADATVTLTFRLIDAEGIVLWSRAFENLRPGSDRSDLQPILKTVISTLIEPFGVVYSRERQRRLANGAEDSRLACINRTYEFLRNRDPARHADARACLAQSTSVDPTFTTGLSLLALVQVVEYQMNIPAAPGEAPPLDRALKAGSGAIRSKPNSARAHAVMADVLMTRGQVAEAKATGEKALALNPYDRTINFYVGTLLIFSGDLARGREVLRDFIVNNPLPAPRARFALFVADYVEGNFEAARRIDLSTDTDLIARAWMARALLAWKAGDQTRTHELLARLYAVNPGWKSDARAELGRYFGSPELAERFAADLAAATTFAMM